MDQNINMQAVAPDEKICESCGEKIKKMAEICPKCGVRQRTPVSKVLLLVMTLFLGSFGAHKFYLRKTWQGVLYLVLSWTGIPGIIALIEFIIYAFTSTEKLQEKYSGSRGRMVIAIIACGFILIAMIGILAAIAIPAFVQYKDRAFQATVISELHTLIIAENDFFAQNGQYSNSLEELNFASRDSKITIEIVNANATCFEATGKHSQFKKTVSVDCNGLK